jgi:hypothetical protein
MVGIVTHQPTLVSKTKSFIKRVRFEKRVIPVSNHTYQF